MAVNFIVADTPQEFFAHIKKVKEEHMSKEKPLIIDFVMKKKIEVTRYLTIKADGLGEMNEKLWKQLGQTKGGDGTKKEWLEGVLDDTWDETLPEWQMESDHCNRALMDRELDKE